MPKLTLTVNGRRRVVTVDAATPLLWVLRDTLGLTGTKYGCGSSLCGACTVLLDGKAVRSCSTPVSAAAGRKVTTIEGLASDLGRRLKAAWVEERVPQCGYCQPGFVMSAAGLLARRPNPTDDEIDAAFRGHVCRCGTYARIRRAVHRAAIGVATRVPKGAGR